MLYIPVPGAITSAFWIDCIVLQICGLVNNKYVVFVHFFQVFFAFVFCTKSGQPAADRIRTCSGGRLEWIRTGGTRTTFLHLEKGRGNPTQHPQEQKRPVQTDPKFACF